MSAFVLSTDHIDLLVTAIQQYRARALMVDPTARFGFRSIKSDHVDPDEIGRTLLTANVASVLHRYQASTDQDERDGYAALVNGYRFRRITLDPVALGAHPAIAVLKAVKSFEYQSCEDPAWSETEAHAWMTSLTAQCIASLPGYNDADTWEYRRPTVRATR